MSAGGAASCEFVMYIYSRYFERSNVKFIDMYYGYVNFSGSLINIVLSGARRSSATRTMTVWASGDVSETGAGGELPGHS